MLFSIATDCRAADARCSDDDRAAGLTAGRLPDVVERDVLDRAARVHEGDAVEGGDAVVRDAALDLEVLDVHRSAVVLDDRGAIERRPSGRVDGGDREALAVERPAVRHADGRVGGAVGDERHGLGLVIRRERAPANGHGSRQGEGRNCERHERDGEEDELAH